MIAPTADSLWSEALVEAFRWHEGQTRKCTGLPYVIHCVEVAASLERLGFHQNVVIAGLLHDLLEDTDVPPDRLRNKFGDHVFEIVTALTERKLDESGQKRPWIDRKRDHISHLRHSPAEVRAVALADQRQNLGSVLKDWDHNAPEFWSAFNSSPLDYANYHRIRSTACQGDEPGIRILFESVDKLLSQLVQRLEETSGIAPARFAESDWAC